MRRIIRCDISFGEFDLVCAKCGKTILTVLSPEYAPASMSHPPVTCNEDGSHTFASQRPETMTFLTTPEESSEPGIIAKIRQVAAEVRDLRDDVKKAISRDDIKKAINRE